jgi:hypothetical protein
MSIALYLFSGDLFLSEKSISKVLESNKHPYLAVFNPNIRTLYKRGFAPNPTHFFVLTQKSKQKKSRLRPLRSKN